MSPASPPPHRNVSGATEDVQPGLDAENAEFAVTQETEGVTDRELQRFKAQRKDGILLTFSSFFHFLSLS